MVDIGVVSASSSSLSRLISRELKPYLDQSVIPRKQNPAKWSDSPHVIPVLSDIELKWLIASASSISSEKITPVNLTVANNRTHKAKRFLLSDKYWFD